MSEPTEDLAPNTDTGGAGTTEGGSVLTQPMDTAPEPAPEAVSTEPDVTNEPAQFTLPDQYADDPRFEGVDSVDKLIEKINGVPQAPASVDEYAATMQGLNDEQMTAFKSQMLDAGLSSQQFEKIAEYYNGNVSANQEMRAKIVDGYVDQVRKDWGDNFDTNLQGAKEALNIAAGEISGLKEMMQDEVLGSHPVTLELFRWIKSKISDDVLLEGDVPGGARKEPEEGGVRYFSTYDKTMEK